MAPQLQKPRMHIMSLVNQLKNEEKVNYVSNE